jgi:hypothetical protein
MLRYFFEKTEEDNKEIFANLNISKNKEYMDMQGKYPVIFLTFKDIKTKNWEDCIAKLKMEISHEYRKHKYLLNSDILGEPEKKIFNDISNFHAINSSYEESIKNLSEYLSKYHKTKVVILIDEYDVPIQSGYMCNYYDEIISFMRNFLSGAFKDNVNLEKGVITGILKIAKESLFSGLNNLSVCTILSQHYSNKFGFEKDEVVDLLKYYENKSDISDVKDWYDGYIFGKTVIYNPWSILNFLYNPNDGLLPYWINTSSNDLVRELISKGSYKIKEELVENLLKGKPVFKEVNEDIVMADIGKNPENVWSFLLFCGYLKPLNFHVNEDGDRMCNLVIPNREVRYLFKKIVREWFSDTLEFDSLEALLKSLVEGEMKIFAKVLKMYVLNTMSYFDMSGNEPEKIYHVFILGLLVALQDTHEVKSNRESGNGRYDVMIIPRDVTKLGIVMEFKKVDEDEDETLETAVEIALAQISEKGYTQELVSRGIEDIMEVGISFTGKKLLLRHRRYRSEVEI